MDKQGLSLMATTVIAVCALMTVLFGLIQISVWPIRKDLAKIEVKIAKIEVKLDQVLAKYQDKQSALK